ncbi:MAG TPA: hypothetical protein VN445_15050 [Rectinemataceae bacterium]|nr:hypothetical protein [Rectinemataceae bacterium]
MYGFNSRRTASNLESAKRFVLAIGQFKTEGKDQLIATARDEKKKLHKFAYSLITSASPADSVRPAFVAAGLSGKTSPQEECEAEMLIAGTELALKNAHPIVILRMMTAFLGFSVFDDVEKWLMEHFGAERKQDEELIIPGDLPDILTERNRSPGSIGQALRLAGPPLVAATLAGCPTQMIDYMKSLAYSPLGRILLDWEIGNARDRLSSEELSDAQNAFMELLTSFRDDAEAHMGTEAEEWPMDVDKELVSDISNLILELDEHVLKSVISGMNPKLAASLIQAMEPIAHDRLFSSVASSKSKKILDALESSTPLSNNELTRRAQIFAQKVLSEIAPRSKTLGKSLPLPARLRQLLTAILSRE